MRLLSTSVLLALFSSLLPAQTTGVTGFNDFWVTPGGLPNSTSCTPLTVNTPTTINLNTSSAPGTFQVFIWSFCGCMPCAPAPAMGTSTCLPPPSSACPGSNQFLEALLFAGCVTIVLPGGSTNAAGFSSIPVPIPLTSPPIVVGMQAVFVGPPGCTVAPFNVLVSPAWNVTFQ